MSIADGEKKLMSMVSGRQGRVTHKYLTNVAQRMDIHIGLKCADSFHGSFLLRLSWSSSLRADGAGYYDDNACWWWMAYACNAWNRLIWKGWICAMWIDDLGAECVDSLHCGFVLCLSWLSSSRADGAGYYGDSACWWRMDISKTCGRRRPMEYVCSFWILSE